MKTLIPTGRPAITLTGLYQRHIRGNAVLTIR